jgi:hypothetical protein
MKKLREAIGDLMNQWEVGAIDEHTVLVEAEKLFEQYYQGIDYPKSDFRSILVEILSQLEILHHQWIIKEDISVIKAFLNTTRGNELQAWDNWIEYWESIDFEQRKNRLKGNEFYTTTQQNT